MGRIDNNLALPAAGGLLSLEQQLRTHNEVRGEIPSLTKSAELADKTSKKVSDVIPSKPRNIESTAGAHPVCTSFYLSSILPIEVDSHDQPDRLDSLSRTPYTEDTPQYWLLASDIWHTSQYKEILSEKFPQLDTVIETSTKQDGSDWQIDLPPALQNKTGKMIYLREIPNPVRGIIQEMSELAGIDSEPEDITPLTVRFVDSPL